jgi:hypothetical protein
MSYNNFTEFPYGIGGGLNKGGSGAGHGTLFITRYGINTGAAEFDVVLPAFMTSFQESFQSNWERETVFGRSDPMQFYGGTQRTLNVAFKVVASSAEVAKSQLAALEAIMQFLYPNYNANNAYSSAPILGIKYENMIRDGNGHLAGTMGNFSFAPNFDEGVFSPRDIVGAEFVNRDGLEIYPQSIDVTFDFYPLHKNTLGWRNGQFLGDSFHPNEVTVTQEDIQAEIDRRNLNLQSDALLEELDAEKAELDNLSEEQQEELVKQAKEAAPGSPQASLTTPFEDVLLNNLKKWNQELRELKENTSLKGTSTALETAKYKSLEQKIATAQEALGIK